MSVGKVMRITNSEYELDVYCTTDRAIEIRARRAAWWTCWQLTIEDLERLVGEIKLEAAGMGE